MGNDLDLFAGEGGEEKGRRRGNGPRETWADEEAHQPLPARMRPRTLEEVRGQAHLVGPGKPFRRMLEGGRLSSCILWGPPGSGKTTLARLLAERTDAAFVAFSAVTEGVARVREIITEGRARLETSGRRTILFCDEIHRFNKAQQDAFLPYVEDGTVVLVGATTENPSFEVNRPLLSRAPVFILEPLSEEALRELLVETLRDEERGLGRFRATAEEEALTLLARVSDGDARRALGALEAAVHVVGEEGVIDEEVAREALQHRHAVYDKSGEEHFNLISALHKAVRGGDPDGALYWLARMLRGGEDPLYLARRLVRMSVEDIGLADPEALEICVAAWRAYSFLGSPEGDLALAEAAVYLAAAPKSNRTYVAWKSALAAAEETASEPVPLHVRNAPTREMKAWGYGRGYQYDPDEPGGVSRQHYLPERLVGRRFYEPGGTGVEPTIAKRLAEWDRRRRGENTGEGPAEGIAGAAADDDATEPDAPGHDPPDRG